MTDILHGDCVDLLCSIPNNSIGSIVTDPPYELGFMGRKWDSTGIAYNVEMWKQCLRVLKPGGHLLAFGGTRTYHRMACAIEDAGFEVRDTICWIYGSGFPKSLNIGKAIDKLQGNEREVLPNPKAKQQTAAKGGIYGDYEATTHISVGTSPFEGYGTALKPAMEPITVARKPLTGTVAQNVLEWGVGGLNIDGCRVETEEKISTGNGKISTTNCYGKYEVREKEFVDTQGRFPANVIHDGSDEVVALFPYSTSGEMNCVSQGKNYGIYGKYNPTQAVSSKSSGSAARFFYVAKASPSERGETNNHPTVKPVELMRYLIRLVTPPGETVLDPFGGSGTTAIAAIIENRPCIIIEKEAEHIEIIKHRVSHQQPTLL